MLEMNLKTKYTNAIGKINYKKMTQFDLML